MSDWGCGWEGRQGGEEGRERAGSWWQPASSCLPACNITYARVHPHSFALSACPPAPGPAVMARSSCRPRRTAPSWTACTSASSAPAAPPPAPPTGGTPTSIWAPRCCCRHTGGWVGGWEGGWVGALLAALWLSGVHSCPLLRRAPCRWMIDSRDDFTQERMQNLNDQCELSNALHLL